VKRPEAAAISALCGAVIIVVCFRWLVPLDEAVYQWLQYHRSCAIDAAARWIDPVVRGVLVALIASSLVRGGWRQPWPFLGLLVLLLLIGNFLVELLKTAIERLRPNSTPEMITGNSFPSGHITATTMVALVAIALIRGRDWPRWEKGIAYGLALACVVAQATARLLTGSHWLSDVVASLLLGAAWVLAAGWLKRLPRRVSAAALLLACLAFFVFDDVPAVRLRLPSALDESRSSIASVEFGTAEARRVLEGEWEDGPPERLGPVAWAKSPDVGVRIEDANEAAAIMKLALRPAIDPANKQSRAHLVISVNEWVAPEICLLRGWREYHLEPPAGVLRRGENSVRFRILTDGELARGENDRGLAAFRYLRFYPSA
jgi:membrane-associated phospholipid phosphatase